MKLEAVIFDWAGTTVDHGSLAPVRAITTLFARHAIQLTDADARRDMGIFKQDHIRRILNLPNIAERWREETGEAPMEADVEALFAEFIPLQMDVLGAHSELIPGAVRVAETLRARGWKIGSTTGYARPMLEVLMASGAAQGYRPDLSLCPDDVGGGRPRPWMCFRIALEFGLSAAATAVKIGDTPSDIEEGLNAGMWAVGVAVTGNEIGLSAKDLAVLTVEDRAGRVERARAVLKMAGAHYVIDSVAECEGVLEEIERRLGAGERP